ncbi:MAG: Gfo/Idh/MocA family protein [Actinomycetota bacterium]
MTTDDGIVRWGIVGTGKIARVLARAIAESRDGALVAVGSRDVERAKTLVGEFGVSRHHSSYEGLIEDESVDIVYVATHHPAHREWAVRAAEAGKHVLCEKPLAMRASDAAEIVGAARANGVFLLEAFAYRCHPQTRELSRLLRDGAIGEIRMVDAVFGYDAGPDPGNYLLAHELGGGGILDVGCYTTSMAHLVAAAAAGATTDETVDVAAAATVGPTGVDVSSAATLVFAGGLLARVACSIEADLDSSVRIYGSEGVVAIPSPWLPGRIGVTAEIVIRRRGSEPDVVAVPLESDVYTVEVDAVNGFVRAGERSASVMPMEESLANMRTLDRWRRAIGVWYEGDDQDAGDERGNRR